MPRVQDCLSARQQLLEDDLQGEVDEGQLGGSCPAGCLPQALCPSASVAPGQDQDAEEEVEESVLFEDSAYDDEDDVDLDVDYVDYEDVNYDNVIDDSEVSEDSVASDEIIPRNSEDEISNSVPDILNEEVLTEEPESVEEVDVNIDSGFLTDSQGCHHHHYRQHYHHHLYEVNNEEILKGRLLNFFQEWWSPWWCPPSLSSLWSVVWITLVGWSPSSR